MISKTLYELGWKTLAAGLLLLVPVSMMAEGVQITATTTMVSDLVKEVGGKHVEVRGLMGPGVDPHLYKPSASDVRALRKAELIFYSGLFLEGRMGELFSKMKRGRKKVFAVTASIPKALLLKPAGFQGHADPHVWGDVQLWQNTVQEVVKGLIKVDPSHENDYRKSGKRVEKEFAELHQWALKRIQVIPESNRLLVTSHDAFNYFGRAYGHEVMGVQGISTVSEAGLADITKVVDLVRERGIKAIFAESSVSQATIKRISKDSGARIGGELFSDACGTPGDFHRIGGESYDVGTYVGMIKHNVNTIVDALKGT